MTTKYIFLDFDGVLHRNGKLRFECVDVFAKAIASLDHVKIVFSTSWREYASVEKLTAYMPESIQDKCIGKTIVIKEPVTQPRYKEIMLYLKQHNIADTDWIAIDDMRSLFPLNCPNLFLIDGSKGFSQGHIKKLQDMLKLELNIEA